MTMRYLAVLLLVAAPALAVAQQPQQQPAPNSAAAAGAAWSRQNGPQAPARTPATTAAPRTTATPANTAPARQPAGAPVQQGKPGQVQQAQPQQAQPLSTPDQIKAEQDRFTDMYRALISYHVLLQGDGVSKEQVDAALYDVQKYVDDLDGRYATDQLFLKDRPALDELKKTLARAHFENSLLNAKGVDLERSITEYEKVVELLGMDPAEWDTTIERSGRLGLLTGASEISYEMGTPREIVEDLKLFWSAGVMTRFLVRSYTMPDRAALGIERIGGANDGFSQASFSIALERFKERVGSGADEFRVALPAGHYRVTSKNPQVQPLEFVIVQGGAPDPIVLNPNTFNLEFASPNVNCRPILLLNGITVRSLQNVPFGTYRVEAPKSCNERLPDKITVEQRNEVTVRTEPEKLDYVREGQPIFLFVTTPPGSTYKLRM